MEGFGERVRRLRRRRGLNIAELSEKLRMNPVAVMGIEDGLIDELHEFFGKLAGALGCSVCELMTGEDGRLVDVLGEERTEEDGEEEA